VASLSQGRTAAAQCGLFTHKSVPVIFEPPCILVSVLLFLLALCTKTEKFRGLNWTENSSRWWSLFWFVHF